jgi:oxalate decarboxylase
MSDVQRRGFLSGAAAFAAATATLGGTRPAATDDKPPRPIRGDKGASIIGPTNPARESQNRDRLAPPPTDRGTVRNLRFSFADVHNRLQPGGWARQVTIREMPIATDLAIVNMRLKAGDAKDPGGAGVNCLGTPKRFRPTTIEG